MSKKIRISFIGGNPLHVTISNGLANKIEGNESVEIGNFYSIGLPKTKKFFDSSNSTSKLKYIELPFLHERLTSILKVDKIKYKIREVIDRSFEEINKNVTNVLFVCTEWGILCPVFIRSWLEKGGKIILLDEWSLFPYAKDYGVRSLKRTLLLNLLLKSINLKSPWVNKFDFFGIHADCNIIDDACYSGLIMFRPEGFEIGRNIYKPFFMPLPIKIQEENEYKLIIYGTSAEQFGYMKQEDWNIAITKIIDRLLVIGVSRTEICYKFHPLEENTYLKEYMLNKGIILDYFTPGEEIMALNPNAIHLSCSSTVVGHAAVMGFKSITLYKLLFITEQANNLFDLFFKNCGITSINSKDELDEWLGQANEYINNEVVVSAFNKDRDCIIEYIHSCI